jgi:hypothetical protein
MYADLLFLVVSSPIHPPFNDEPLGIKVNTVLTSTVVHPSSRLSHDRTSPQCIVFVRVLWSGVIIKGTRLHLSEYISRVGAIHIA